MMLMQYRQLCSVGWTCTDCELRCRDIKLENIFIGGDGRVKLGDFGLTMSMKQEVAISPVGTVEYMAPEVSSRDFGESGNGKFTQS